MNEVLKQILKNLGFSDNHIAELEKVSALKEEELKTFKPEIITEDLKAHLSKLTENDPNYAAKLKEIETAAIGRHYAILDRHLKQISGLTEEQIKDLSVDKKLQLFKDTVSKSENKDIKKLQEENLALIQQIETLNSVEIPKIKGETENYKRQFETERTIESILSGSKLKTKPGLIMPALKSELNTKFDIEVSNGDLILYNKGTKIQPKNKSGNNLLNGKEFINEWLKDNDIIDNQQTKTEPPKVVVKTDDGAGNSFHSSHIAKAMQRAAELKEGK